MSLRQGLNAGSSPETVASRIIALDREPGECARNTVNSCDKTVMIAVNRVIVPLPVLLSAPKLQQKMAQPDRR
jgi:hypothetical protein